MDREDRSETKNLHALRGANLGFPNASETNGYFQTLIAVFIARFMNVLWSVRAPKLLKPDFNVNFRARKHHCDDLLWPPAKITSYLEVK